MRLYGARAAYARPGEPAFSVPGVFDRVHVEMFDSDGAAVSTRRTHLTVRLADFPDGIVPEQGHEVQVALRGDQAVDLAAPLPAGALLESFTVADVQPDGAGAAVLILSARQPDPLA